MKAVIYGSAQLGIQIAWHIKNDYEILGFIDSDSRKYGKTLEIDGVSYNIYPPEKLLELTFDKVFIGSEVEIYIEQIKKTLINLGIPEAKFDFSLTFIPHFARLNFIKTLSLAQRRDDIKGAVAELGVFRGDCAKHINAFYFDRDCYLLDTFEGFDKRDCDNEEQKGFSQAKTKDFSKTSLEIVKEKMPFVENCHFIKGYFPESAKEIPANEQFCFVNIDVDLYQPILAGLEFFYPKLVGGGAILVHDYFHPYYTGVKEAVDIFCNRFNIKILSIGDAFSALIVK